MFPFKEITLSKENVMMSSLALRRRVKVGKPGNGADVRAVEDALEAVGYYELPVFGTGRHAPQELDDAIRTLQTDHGLKPDGNIESDGPTAARVDSLLAGRRRLLPDDPGADSFMARVRRERAAAQDDRPPTRVASIVQAPSAEGSFAKTVPKLVAARGDRSPTLVGSTDQAPSLGEAVRKLTGGPAGQSGPPPRD
jgi:hypothetical protein